MLYDHSMFSASKGSEIVLSLVPNGQTLFVVDLAYTADLDQIDPLLDPHVAFLERCYASGHFLASGPKVPRTGGVILATATHRAEFEALLEDDPFKQQGVAQYTVTEFRPSMVAERLA